MIIDTSTFDFGMSPWSSIKLVRNRILHLHENTPGIEIKKGGIGLDLGLGYNINHSKKLHFSHQYTPIFSIIPSDRSVYLISSGDGELHKIMRYGSATLPRYFISPMTGKIEIEFIPNTKLKTFKNSTASLDELS